MKLKKILACLLCAMFTAPAMLAHASSPEYHASLSRVYTFVYLKGVINTTCNSAFAESAENNRSQYVAWREKNHAAILEVEAHMAGLFEESALSTNRTIEEEKKSVHTVILDFSKPVLDALEKGDRENAKKMCSLYSLALTSGKSDLETLYVKQLSVIRSCASDDSCSLYKPK
jgi:hypothetical protein